MAINLGVNELGFADDRQEFGEGVIDALGQYYEAVVHGLQAADVSCVGIHCKDAEIIER
jgi:hypothetical protein